MKSTSTSAWSHAMTGETLTPNFSAERCGISSPRPGTSSTSSLSNGFTNGSVSAARRMENTVSVAAIGAMMPRRTGPLAVSVTTSQCGNSALPIGTSTGRTNGRNTAEPTTLESVWASAVRRAPEFPPTAAIHAVTVVPMFAPKRAAIAVSWAMRPWEASVMAIALVAAACTTAETATASRATRATSATESAPSAANAPRTDSQPLASDTPLDMK